MKAPNAPKNNLCRAAPFELRAEPDGDGFTLEGYAAVFGEKTRIDSWFEGKFDEEIVRGAFAKTLKERTPVLQFDHGHDLATGSVPIGAIEKVREDAHGLLVHARLHDNARVEPIRQAIASGAIDGMSFRFRVIREEWDESDKLEVPLRTIREVELFELGPVVFPAYTSTSVGVRSLLAGLADEDRARLLADLRTELSADAAGDGTSADEQDPDAAGDGTSEQDPDAARQGTSGMTTGEREAVFRSLLIRKETAA